MSLIQIGDTVMRVCFAKTEFKCPYCEKEYDDYEHNDKYMKRIMCNKSGITKVKCSCNERFYVAFYYAEGLYSFKSLN
jgi:hypothetical protein